jgi:replicative superfamily II helicase
VPQTSLYVSNSGFLEKRDTNGLTLAIDQIILGARVAIWIAVPWFYTSTHNYWIESLIEALAKKRKEGLDVRLFIRPDVSNHETVNKLQLAKVKIFSKKEVIRHIHTKMILNELKLLAMTANITDFDLYRNLNTGILTGSEDDVRKAKSDFQKLVEKEVFKQAEFKDTVIDDVLPKDIADFFRDQYPKLNPVQTEVAPYVVQKAENLLIGTETGTGKTLMAEVAIWNLLSRNERAKSLYIAPLRAITMEKEREWQKFASAGLPVYKITGDEETVDEEKARKARIVLATGEKWDSLTRKPGRFPFVRNMDLIVLDEVHIIDDETRGPTTEVLVARLKRTLPKARIIGLSATMRNIEQLAHWINGEYYRNTSYRPVPLTIAFQDIPDARYYNVSEQAKDKIVLDSVRMLLSEETGTGRRGKILVFAGSRRKAEEAAEKIVASMKLLDEPYLCQASNRKLRALMEKGVAFVHAGLNASDRKMVINAFDEGPIDVLSSTTSLAWGVNVAARTVIIRDIRVAMQKEIDFLDLKQMIGRAGRVGRENVAYAIVLVPFMERQLVETALLEGKDIESKLERYLLDHINAEVNLGIIKNERTLREWFTSTFWYYQKHESRLDWQNFLKDQLSLLIRTGFVTKNRESLVTTQLGRLTSDWYIHVKTVINLLDGLSRFDFHTYGDSERAELYLLRLIATSEEDFSVVLRSVEEREKVESFTVANPIFADCEQENAKAGMVLFDAMRGREFPEEEYQTIRLAIGILGFVSELGVLNENYSVYVVARDMARRLQYHDARGSGQLLNLIWFSTANNDEKERNVRATFSYLDRKMVQSPRNLRECLLQEELEPNELPNQLVSNTTASYAFIETPNLDGKHFGEDIKLILPGLPEKATIFCISTGTGDDKALTLRDSNFLSLSKKFPELVENVGIRSFWLEFFTFNRFGWDYAKAFCELIILPNSWKPSVLKELQSLLSEALPQIRSTGFVRRLVNRVKWLFSYAAYANDFIEQTPIMAQVAMVLTRHAETPMKKMLEIGHFARKQILQDEALGEPEPMINVLRELKTNRLGFTVLVASLLRSSGVDCSLVEVRREGKRSVIPVCSEGGHNFLLDVFDEASLGLDVRGGSKQFEIVQFHFQAVIEPEEESRHLEWVEQYSGDNIRKRYRIRNFTDQDYSAMGSIVQTTRDKAMPHVEKTQPKITTSQSGSTQDQLPRKGAAPMVEKEGLGYGGLRRRTYPYGWEICLTCGGTIHWNQSSRKEICDKCEQEEENCRCQREYT